jgi:hypothetical protein
MGWGWEQVQKVVEVADAAKVASKKQVVKKPNMAMPVQKLTVAKPAKKTVVRKPAVEKPAMQKTSTTCKKATRKVFNKSTVDPLGWGSWRQSRLHNGLGLG